MKRRRQRIVFLGLSITSSWGNGHATTYRALTQSLAARGHDVLFLERDVSWYAGHRDLAHPPYAEVALYGSVDEVAERWGTRVRDADLVVVGSYVPDGAEIGAWVQRTARGVCAFYDIDTPVTLEQLAAGTCSYLTRELIPRYDLYLSFTGGPVLDQLERVWGARRARALYCSADPRLYRPERRLLRWDLGYLGTYAPDRQPGLERLLLEPARRWPRGRFVVGGPQYPESVRWPANVERHDHVPPPEHAGFYSAQSWTLNLTRAAMTHAGWSPSVRLFEAAACGVPLLSDAWDGLERFFEPGREVLLVASPDDVLRALRDISEEDRRKLGLAARQRVLGAHTSDHRAGELESYVFSIAEERGREPAGSAA